MSKMQTHWLSCLLVVMAMAGLGTSLVPAVCPNLLTNMCYYNNVAMLQPNANSQIYAIGGMFDIREKGADAFTCGPGYSPPGVMLSQALLWSLDYWQNRTGSNSVSVGSVVFDTCFREDQTIQNILGFEQCNIRIQNIDRHNLVGFIGTCNSDGLAAASLTADMDLTVISPLANLQELSNHEKYPYFLRTIPSVATDIKIMAHILDYVNTEYVAIIYTKNKKVNFEHFKTEMQSKSICITASYAMEGDETDAVIKTFVENRLEKLDKVRFIVLLLPPPFTARFMKQVSAVEDARNMNLVFLMTSDLPRSADVFAGNVNSVAANNAIILEREEPDEVEAAVAAFEQYWNATVRTGVSSNTRISNPFLTDYLSTVADKSKVLRSHWGVANTILAAKAFVEGVRRAGSEICLNNNNYLCPSFFDVSSRGSNVNLKIRQQNDYFTPIGPDRKFQNGDLRADMVGYKVFRYSYMTSTVFTQVGSYSDGQLTFSTDLRAMGSYRAGQCQDSPCLQCGELPTTTTTTTLAYSTQDTRCVEKYPGNYSVVRYPRDQEITGAYMETPRMDSEFGLRFDIGQRWIIALGVLAGLGILAVFIFEIYILYKLLGTRMGQKWRTMWLGQLLLFGIFLCYLTLFAYLFIPTKATCGITRFGVGVSYSICFAVLLVKLMVILTSKSSENSLLPGDMESPNYLRGIYQFLMFVFVVGVQVVIDTQWLITVPPEAVKVTTSGGKDVWVCNHYTFRASSAMESMITVSGFVRNEFENHVLSLVYIMFLILITTILALNAHGIITNHRESVFIGIGAGFSIPIWLAWTLVAGLNKDHAFAHEFGDACIAFGLFLTATLILFAMFLPKVRQLVSMGVEGIYFEDDRDTVYAGSVIMAPPSYKSRPNSVILLNNNGFYSEPVVVGNGDTSTYLRHPGSQHPTPASTYSAPPTYLKKGANSTIRGGSVLQVTDDLVGRRPLEKKRPMSEVAYGTGRRPRSEKGTLPRSQSHTSLGAL